MNAEQFTENLAEIVREVIGSHYHVWISPRHDGATELGIVIHNKTKDQAPCYLVQPMYENYLKGECIESVANTLLMFHIECELEEAS